MTAYVSSLWLALVACSTPSADGGSGGSTVAAVADTTSFAPDAPVAEPFAASVPADLPVAESLAPEPPPASDPFAPTEPPLVYELRRGETLAHFSRWSGLPVEVIAEASGLDLNGDYAVGTKVIVPVDEDRRLELEHGREMHQLRRVDGYLASRGGAVGTEFYTVKTGDTAWTVAEQHQGVPLWLVEAYNPSVDLDRLRPGDQLMLPVVADVVVDAE